MSAQADASAKKGMIWYDESTERTLDEKIERAYYRYAMKYGNEPVEVYAHPSAIVQERTMQIGCNTLQVRQNKYLAPHYFWFGGKE